MVVPSISDFCTTSDPTYPAVRVPGHLLVQVLFDEVVMLEQVPKLLVSLMTGTASFGESG